MPPVCLSVQLSIHPMCLYICLPSQYAHLYFKGLFFCPSSHTAAWRHQSWAGTQGSMAQSQLEPLPVWVDNVFPQSGHCGTVGPEESIGGKRRWLYTATAEVSVTKQAHPANIQLKRRMHLVTQSRSQIISNFLIWCGKLSILLPYTAQLLLDIGITMFFTAELCVCEHSTSYGLWVKTASHHSKSRSSLQLQVQCFVWASRSRCIWYCWKAKHKKKQMMRVAMQETKKHYCWMLANIQVKTISWLRSLAKLVPVSQRSPLKPPCPPFYTLHRHKQLPRCVSSDSLETLRSFMQS